MQNMKSSQFYVNPVTEKREQGKKGNWKLYRLIEMAILGYVWKTHLAESLAFAFNAVYVWVSLHLHLPSIGHITFHMRCNQLS